MNRLFTIAKQNSQKYFLVEFSKLSLFVLSLSP